MAALVVALAALYSADNTLYIAARTPISAAIIKEGHRKALVLNINQIVDMLPTDTGN